MKQETNQKKVPKRIRLIGPIDLLDYQGCDIYRKCLSCPGKFRLLGDRSDRYGSEEFDYCEEDCAEADRTISDICAGYIEELEDYYIVQRSSEG